VFGDLHRPVKSAVLVAMGQQFFDLLARQDLVGRLLAGNLTPSDQRRARSVSQQPAGLGSRERGQAQSILVWGESFGQSDGRGHGRVGPDRTRRRDGFGDKIRERRNKGFGGRLGKQDAVTIDVTHDTRADDVRDGQGRLAEAEIDTEMSPFHHDAINALDPRVAAERLAQFPDRCVVEQPDSLARLAEVAHLFEELFPTHAGRRLTPDVG
jgi:hypothetical protein